MRLPPLAVRVAPLRAPTGMAHGRSPAQWTAEVQPGDAKLQKWKEWWTAKRELYPVPKSGIQRLSF